MGLATRYDFRNRPRSLGGSSPKSPELAGPDKTLRASSLPPTTTTTMTPDELDQVVLVTLEMRGRLQESAIVFDGVKPVRVRNSLQRLIERGAIQAWYVPRVNRKSWQCDTWYEIDRGY